MRPIRDARPLPQGLRYPCGSGLVSRSRAQPSQRHAHTALCVIIPPFSRHPPNGPLAHFYRMKRLIPWH
ncbi:hypothetical protein C6A77_14085 [Pseudomonas sp. AFG_SD02_1510_Pfu_092]|nr:hypothetical protein C6A77_14085 [Pseudomonas sp. AFG_SD02_1510_Pfu_092]